MKIYVFCNQKDRSRAAYSEFIPLVKEFGYEVVDEFTGGEDLLACIGGDGTFLSFVHKCGFPEVPIIGINTGHLGFFQEALPTNLRETMEYITKGEYQVQKISPVQAKIITRRGEFMRTGLNEIVVRGPYSHASHYDISALESWCGEPTGVCRMIGGWYYDPGTVQTEDGHLWELNTEDINENELLLIWFDTMDTPEIKDDQIVKVWSEIYD